MPFEPPVILGWDMVSPLGTETAAQVEAVLAGKSGVGPLTRFTPPPGFPLEAAGQVPPADFSAWPFLSGRDLAMWPSPVFPHAMLVVRRALLAAGLDITPEIAPEVGVTFSSAVGGMDQVLAADRELNSSGRLPKPYVPPNSCINMPTGKVAIHTGATGPSLSTIAACATGSASLAVGAMLIAQGLARAVICGAVDFPLVEPILGGFATMNGAYRSRPGRDDGPPQGFSRPFSVHRAGFVVGEGAGALILASAEFARAHGLKPRARLLGWSMTTDAHHYVAPHRPTVARAMAGALAQAGVKPGDIGAVSAHAASTKVGDLVEFQALTDVFGPGVPPASALKSQTGHTMGASSALETIVALEALERGVLPPTLNHRPDPEIPLDLAPDAARPHPHDLVLKNAFGFGGHNVCLVLGAPA